MLNIELDLEFDEGILLQNSDVERIGKSTDTLKELILTNKNIICVSEVSTGFFSKPKIEVAKIPLQAVKVLNGQAQVMQARSDNLQPCLQVLFTHGREYFVFKTSPKKEIPKWMSGINQAITGVPLDLDNHTPSLFSDISSALSIGVKSVAHTARQAISASLEEIETPIANERTHPPEQVPPVPPEITTNYSQRQQEYAGVLLKCPNCGSTISQTTAICPECGHQITGQTAVISVQTFANQLMDIESTRKRKKLFSSSYDVDPTDMRKLTLIRNFPIPNSVSDILEFMMLAVANIDVNLSKKTLTNKFDSWGKSQETTLTIARTISDAWVAKMQQVYQKAEIAFPNDPAFESIQKIYYDKLKELKIKVQ